MKLKKSEDTSDLQTDQETASKKRKLVLLVIALYLILRLQLHSVIAFAAYLFYMYSIFHLVSRFLLACYRRTAKVLSSDEDGSNDDDAGDEEDSLEDIAELNLDMITEPPPPPEVNHHRPKSASEKHGNIKYICFCCL